jgi:hypothetical protein
MLRNASLGDEAKMGRWPAARWIEERLHPNIGTVPQYGQRQTAGMLISKGQAETRHTRKY